MLALSFHYSLVKEQINIPPEGNQSMVQKFISLVKVLGREIRDKIAYSRIKFFTLLKIME